MRRPCRAQLAALLIGPALAAGIAGCGDDEEGAELPQEAVAELDSRLGQIDDRITFAQANPGAQGAGACQDIVSDSYPAVRSQLDALPDGVDDDLREALEESFGRLQQLVDEECEGVAQEQPEETPAPTPEPEPEPEEPDQTDTETDALPEQPETTPEEQPEEDDDGGTTQPEDDGGGNDGGGGDKGGGKKGRGGDKGGGGGNNGSGGTEPPPGGGVG